ncbi:leukocyte surface antigen CD47 isoform X5 [Tympanuchus pallidicinctus]|uniref:leukocyte surface antigen CD47 isoform X5 n=1 Tax=Tympanuchus pallidicinctus TaxID=109042 RepID=UPI00228745A6|nr:leukocyte surface antigen CD47 isoform X5 [Tympanuchus pallidicinctus]
MWLLTAGAFFAVLGAGSTQLVFNAVDFVEKYACNDTVVLPCIVINLKENNDSSMHVSWKKQGQVIFSFSGPDQQTYRHESVPSANFLSKMDLSKGVASLQLKNAEATDGNYSCEVTELNREGETKMELRTRMERQFDLIQSIVISALLVFIIALCWAQLGVIALKCETVRKKKKHITVACSIFTVIAVVAVVLFIQDGSISMNQIGLAFTILPAGMLMVLQYSIFKMVLDDLTHKGYALLGFQVVGYIVAVVGFALSVSACPSVLLSVVIAGLVVMAVADLLALVYVYSCSRMKDHQTPRKAVEEPLNDTKGVMLE